jgi:DNA-binding CsgD family transcriptional regulator
LAIRVTLSSLFGSAIGLLERESELTELGALVEGVRAGQGAALVVEGVGGIGKTRLLEAAVAGAEEAGSLVLAARGHELEREVGYGVVRQLFEGPLSRAAGAERDELLTGAAGLALAALEPAAGVRTLDPGSTLHGLYWLAANLAERRPCLLVVDDTQWADPPSLRFLLYLVRRLQGLRLAVLVAVRPGEPGADQELLGALLAEEGVRIVRPGPLSGAATAALLEAEVGRAPEDPFAAACLESTGGNPFLLVELIGALREERLEPTTSNAARVSELSPASVERLVSLRLRRLGAAAGSVARATAVLGADAAPRHAAALANLGERAVAQAIDQLQAAGIVGSTSPLAFRHPLLRQAVYGDIRGAERALAHARAARLLHDEGAPLEHIAGQLLAAEERGDRWAVDLLRQAARRALAGGAAQAAVVYLRRAVAEPAPADTQAALLGELGTAELQAGKAEGLDTLEAAIERLTDPRERALAVLDWARGATGDPARLSRAVPALETALEGIRGSDRELELRLEAQLAFMARFDLRSEPRLRRRISVLAEQLEGNTPAEQLVLAAAVGLEPAGRARSAAEAAELAQRALTGELLAEMAPLGSVAMVLLYADRLDTLERVASDALAAARATGSVGGFVLATALLASLAFNRGELRETEAQASAGYELAETNEVRRPPLLALRIHVLLEQGRHDDAERLLVDGGATDVLPEVSYYNLLLYARGRLRLAQGSSDDGLADLLDLGRRYERFGIRRPIPAWRSSAAIALAASGERKEALRLAEEELELARLWDTPRTIGVALRTLGLLERKNSSLDLLRQATEVLNDSPARLERAHTLAELGAALAHSGRTAQARSPLERAMDLAHECGADALAERSRDELRALGYRPRRFARTGAESLTPSQRRVAEMAATGMTNREIAQALFVSTSTIETHLRHTYQKLGVDGRGALADSLRAASANT